MKYLLHRLYVLSLSWHEDVLKRKQMVLEILEPMLYSKDVRADKEAALLFTSASRSSLSSLCACI